MKFNLACLWLSILTVSVPAFGQGTFVYDQQSSDENQVMEGIAGFGQAPLGQSFTPMLDSVGFIRIDLLGGVGSGSFHVDLLADSLTGPVLGTSSSVNWAGPGFVNFLFDSPVAVTPGTTYYFQPVLEVGNGWGLNGSSYSYQGGTES